jgi:hypothetical protein
MKIDEPKTPYAKQYNPAEDEEEIEAINASEVVVDELDQVRGKKAPPKDADIPDIDIGDAEMPPVEHARTPESERRVMVEPDQDEGFHGEAPPDLPAEEREKHAKFEQARKRHYEMKNVKNLLGYDSRYLIADFTADDITQPSRRPRRRDGGRWFGEATTSDYCQWRVDPYCSITTQRTVRTAAMSPLMSPTSLLDDLHRITYTRFKTLLEQTCIWT